MSVDLMFIISYSSPFLEIHSPKQYIVGGKHFPVMQ